MKATLPTFLRCQLAAFVMCGLLLPFIAHAQLEPDGANDTNYTALGSQHAGSTVAVEGSYNGQNYFASGILIDPYDVLTAGHYAAAVTIFQVNRGASVYSPNASVGVQSVVVYPGYNGTGNSPDIAIAHLISPVGNKVLTLASVTSGDLLTLTGYGYHGTPSTGVSFDGALRGWLKTVDNGNFPGGVDSLYYDNVDFYPSSSSQPGLAESETSGGGVYNSLGLVGMLDYSTQGTSPLGSQQFLDFSKSGVIPWIETNVIPYVVYRTVGTNLVLQWNGSFILQSSTNAEGAFTDIANAVSPYTNATSAPKMFFRLRSTP